jgi:hypothetical protein
MAFILAIVMNVVSTQRFTATVRTPYIGFYRSDARFEKEAMPDDVGIDEPV